MDRQVEAMLRAPSPAAEARIADRLRRAVATGDRLTFDGIRDEVMVGRTAIGLSKEHGGEIDLSRGEEGISKTGTSRSDEERRAANAARQWFSAFLKKHEISTLRLDEGGGVNNPTGNRTSAELTKDLLAILDERHPFERNRRFNSYTGRMIDKLILLTKEISSTASAKQKLQLRQLQTTLEEARDSLPV